VAAAEPPPAVRSPGHDDAILPIESRRLRAYLELLRPANVATALADVLAGYALTGLAPARALGWLLLSTACLYAGGIVLNDVFDRRLDAVERPERPIPSGRIRASTAAALGASLLGAGVVAAGQATVAGAVVAAAIVAAVLCYDAVTKPMTIVGPVNMGLCRGLNLVLGLAAAPAAIRVHWPLALIPWIYIVGVTVVSRGEVAGGTKRAAAIALGVVDVSLVALVWVATLGPGSPATAVVLLLILGWRIVPPFIEAWREPGPTHARCAVRAGVLSLVLVDAVIAAAYAGMIWGLAVLGTALAAGWLARLFAVT
jgi:4-hydroxybenzoate polyprenyltransferase